ncbi:uncharacterized protein TNCT_616301 [Trichonephila clavata]|uniref:Uncharacterized protein n=1 Tax=Trichonephila clavata TaxID=2740835 RepID=A0A8X6F597_TRICU|nr:uncharacterized protein TNCT_616301 [Trichonephila clavata]
MPFIADDNLWCQDASGKTVDLSWLDNGPNVVVEQTGDVLQELSQNDLHGLVPETEEEEILRHISDPSFELESIFAVISNGEADAKTAEEEDADTIILSVQQFQQQLEEEFSQQQQQQQQHKMDTTMTGVTSSSFHIPDSSCLFQNGVSNMAVSNPLLHQRLTSSSVTSSLTSSGNQASDLLGSVLGSPGVRPASNSGPSTSIQPSSSCSSTMPSSSTELTKDGRRKYPLLVN